MACTYVLNSAETSQDQIHGHESPKHCVVDANRYLSHGMGQKKPCLTSVRESPEYQGCNECFRLTVHSRVAPSTY